MSERRLIADENWPLVDTLNRGGRATSIMRMSSRRRWTWWLIGCLWLSAGWAQSQEAREPFFAPSPPSDAYDYPKAADAVRLRGLLVTDDTQLAVVFVQSLGGFRVVRLNERLEVTIDGLRHVFTVEKIGERRLLLLGADRNWYEIGVLEDG